MFRRFGVLVVVAVMLTFVLSACGDEKAEIPTYSGATAVTVPDSFKSQFSTTGVKNGNVAAYKSADDATKVKSGLSDGFKKNGWDDKTSDLTASMGDSLKQIEAIGAFAIGFQKGSKAAAVIGLPGTVAEPLGLTGVGEKDTVYLIISGDK
jgi:ABC-type uncharacterized transport system auxiliary subunit